MALGISAAAWVGIGAVATAGATVYGANKASKTQERAARDAGERSDRQFDISRQDQLALLAQQREDQAPYRQAGTNSLARIMAGTADGGEFSQKFSLRTFEQDPGYAFRQSEGERAIGRAAAASGNSYSGATLKALARFNSGLADQEFSDAYGRFEGEKTSKFNRLASLAGIGQTATNATQQAGTNAYGNIGAWGNANAANVGRLMQDAGEARASGYVATSNAIGQGIKGLANAYQMSQAPADFGVSNPLY